jgi:hypothetical protein
MQTVPTASRFLPNLDRISVLSATILLAYTLTGIISIPSRQLSAQLPGFYIEVQINIQTMVSLLVTTLAVSGTDWLLREHPLAQNQHLFQHWLIPALTAWVIGIPLYQGALGLYWWLGIFLGGSTLILVLVAEYIVIDPDDARYTIASVGLNAVAYALFFLLAVTLRAAEFRLFLIVPALTLGIGLISLRTLNLRLKDQEVLPAVGVCAVILAQITAAAHYLPLSPVAYGLFLLGPAYGITSFLGNLGEGKIGRKAVTEPLLVWILFWGLTWWYR